ncbi:S49 family peptidase [Maridesulfovibrio sp.]|uniref:S49 family peptidase n=1 Tax=Maridesulfovibrio sp. TaxID=2795000 RepID=UPI003AFF88CB
MKNKKAFNALVGEVWALAPNKMEQVAAFAEALMEGRNNGEVFAQVAGESSKGKSYFMTRGVAVIPVVGVIARRMNMFQAFSGGASTELIGKQILQAAADDDVNAIVLDIDSPGGGCFGLTALAETIRSVRESGKPVVSHTSELMCSAAYWIGSAATEMICTVDAEVGSIGVAAMHIDRSGQDENEGVKRTILSAGHYKRIASDEKPLSEEGREYLQARVDHYYSLFVDAVAENRSMSVEDVLSKLADGSTHIGQEALNKGFVDAIGSLEFAVSRALDLSKTDTQEEHMSGTSPDGGTGAHGGSSGVNLATLTADQLTAANPGLAAELCAQGAETERKRVLELFDADADLKLTLSAVSDGTSPKDFYKAALTAQREGQAKALDTFEQEMSESAGQDGQQSKASEAKETAEFDALVEAHMKAENCSRGAAIIAIGRKHPDAHKAWLNSKN